MNKKGFTLIELLAVIVLLGLLTAFLLPAVSKYIIQTRDNTYELYEADMKTSAQNMMNECVEENKANCIPKDGLKRRLTLSELVSTGFSERLRDPKNETQECDPFKSFVTVRNDDSHVTNLTYDVCLVCGDYKSDYCKTDEAQELDTPTGCLASDDATPPACGITIGSSTIWSNKDREIIIGCSDDCSGCVQDTFSAKIDYDVETAVIEIADNAGKRTNCPVDAYVDKTKPTCTLEVVGTVGDNGWYKAGTNPKVKLKTKTDNLSGLATYGMGTSKFNYDFNKETEYTVSDGITTVYGYVKDNAGNVGTCSVEIKYDSVPPKIDSVDYGTVVYPKADIATKDGATITLNNITSEYGTIYGIYIYMNNGTGGTVTIKEGTNTLRSGLTIPSSTSKLKNNFQAFKTYSALSFTFGSATEANNVSRIELLTRNDSGYYTNQNVTMYINSMDSISGKADYSFDNGSTYQSDNFKTYSVLSKIDMKVSDYSGNKSSTTTKNITNIDKTDPKCTVSFGSNSVTTHENNYYWLDVPVTLTKDDNPATSSYAMSSTRNYGLKITNGVLYNMLSTGTQTTDTNGTVWYGYVRDRAGNTSDCNSTVKKDSQNPSCTLTQSGTAGVEGWYRSNVTISFNPKQDNDKDGVQSGLAFYQINTTSGNPSSWTTQNSNTQSTDTSGTTWYGHVKDVAGHTASCNTTVKKDTVAPTCTITSSGNVGDNGWYVSNVAISLSSRNDDRSGIYQYGIDSYNSSTSATQSSDTTGTTYVGMVEDKAGNEATCRGTVKKDTVAPSCNVNITQDNSASGVSGTVTCSDDISGCASGYSSHSFTNKKAATNGSASAPEKYEWSNNINHTTYSGLIIKDNAGHTNSCSYTINSYCRFNSCTNSECGPLYTKTTKKCIQTLTGYDKTTRYCERYNPVATSASGTYSTSSTCTTSTCSESGCTCKDLCQCGSGNNYYWNHSNLNGLACSLKSIEIGGATACVITYNYSATGTYSKTNSCTTSTCSESGCSCSYSYTYKFDDTPSKVGINNCTVGSYFNCNSNNFGKSYVSKCDPIYGYSINNPTLLYNETSCTEVHPDCDVNHIGANDVSCEPTGSQTCRTVACGCETFYYRYGTGGSSPSTNSGSNQSGACSGNGEGGVHQETAVITCG